MTEKLTEINRLYAVNRAGGSRLSERLHVASLVFVIGLLLGGFGLGVLHAKPKTDKFEGTVVVVGPKAITVKSRHNIYMVRTFHYSARLEQKILRKKPDAGKKVTVHYVRGSDLALRVD